MIFFTNDGQSNFKGETTKFFFSKIEPYNKQKLILLKNIFKKKNKHFLEIYIRNTKKKLFIGELPNCNLDHLSVIISLGYTLFDGPRKWKRL